MKVPASSNVSSRVPSRNTIGRASLDCQWLCKMLILRRELVHQLRPLLFDDLSEVVGDFRETLRLKQELEILLHHDVVGDNPGRVDALRPL